MKTFRNSKFEIRILVLLLLLGGCAGFTPGENANFWTQCIKLDGYGLTYASPYGPVNLGRLTYHRNVECEHDLKLLPIPIPAP